MGTGHWKWPAQLDALTAAPRNHQLLLPVPPHSLENVGDTELRVIMVEKKP